MSKDTYNEYFTDVSQGGTYFQLTFYTNEEEKFLAMETLARKCIDAEPTVDVVEVRHGTWLPIIERSSYLDPPFFDTAKCSSCGYVVDVSEMHYKYCPECGAKMDERKEENEG